MAGHFNPRPYQHKLTKPLEGRIPGPNTGFEVIVPGRQGIRALRELNPARGSAYLHWDLPPRSFQFLPVVSRSRVARLIVPSS